MIMFSNSSSPGVSWLKIVFIIYEGSLLDDYVNTHIHSRTCFEFTFTGFCLFCFWIHCVCMEFVRESLWSCEWLGFDVVFWCEYFKLLLPVCYCLGQGIVVLLIFFLSFQNTIDLQYIMCFHMLAKLMNNPD